MSEIRFYHLTHDPIEKALPRLLEKILDKGWRAVVKLGSSKRVDDVNSLLWTYTNGSFLPHGALCEGMAERQPIWLTQTDENPNGAQVLVLAEGVSSDHLSEFPTCLEIFDGHDSDHLACARTHWRLYKQAGHRVLYYRQTKTGGWVEEG